MKKSGVAGVQELQNETAAFRPVDGVTYTEGHEGHKEMGDQLGGTGHNIAVARFLDMPRRIAQERVPTASNVGSRDVTWASQPTPVIPFGVFGVFRGAHSLDKAGLVTETQFLIGLRVLCGLLCSALSTLHRVPVGDGFREAKRDASRPWTSRTLRARHSSLQACQHRVLCGCGYAASLSPCHSLPLHKSS